MIYFDNAATTLRKPESVVRAVAEAMSSLGNAGRGAHSASMGANHTIFETRMELSDFFHGPNAKNVVFTMNSTESLNIAIKGIFQEGDHVLSTVLEHNSVLRPLYELEERGVEHSFVPADSLGRVSLSDFERLLRPNTKAIVCTHASNLTGNLLDIERIGEFAHARGLLFIVDASQTAGVYPIDMEKQGIDILCFTGHKSLLGPQGTGGLIVRDGIRIRPLLSGGTGIETYNPRQPEELPTHLEAGTLNGHGIAGLCAAIRYLKEEGIERIREQELRLMKLFHDGAEKIPGVKIYGDFETEERCPIVPLNLSNYDSSLVSDELYSRFAIATRPGGHCAPLMHRSLGTEKQGIVRFSFSHYNTEEEVDFALRALRTLSEE